MRRRQFPIALAHQALVALATTWPLARHWRTQLPLGSEGVATVPQFNLWTLRWNADRIAHGLHGYWDAPIFAPLRGTFARSEAQPLTGLLFWLLHPIGGDVGTYNLVLWVLLVTNALAAMALARRLGAGLGAALLVGTLAQTLPFTFNELGVLQLVPLAGLWWLLERLVAYRAAPSTARAAGAAAAGCVLALTSGYYALFTAATLVGIAPWFVWPPGRPLRARVRDGAVAVAVAAVLAGPFLLSQQANTSDERWSTETVTDLSASVGEWWQHSELAFGTPIVPARDHGQALWPGAALLALGIVGVVRGRGRRRVVAAALLGGVVAFGISLGLHLEIGGFAPYSLLRDHVPGFDRLRSPFRAAAIAQALLVVLAAVGIVALVRHRVGRAVAIALVALATLESVHWDQPTARVPDVADLDWVRWLADAPAGPVAMIPFPPTGYVEDYEDTTTAMLAGLEHGHPLVNGYTGLFPQEYRDLRYHMELFPDTAEESMTALDGSVAVYVVLRDDIAQHDRAEQLLDAAGWRLAFDGRSRDVWSREAA